MKMPYARFIRDRVLRETDWTQREDVKRLKGPDWVAKWEKYCQELRDLPSKHKDGEMIEWPTPPV